MVKRVLINVGDKIKFDFDGYSGKTCVEEFDNLLSSLRANGVDVKDAEMIKKADYHTKNKRKQEATITQG
ncbi:MAG: hypothetical protein HY376_02150 [Candidatus Blackburnbacteria bacterium]|nr:hypothetical protein [Candidatus Blackburnbacteria bacterium]